MGFSLQGASALLNLVALQICEGASSCALFSTVDASRFEFMIWRPYACFIAVRHLFHVHCIHVKRKTRFEPVGGFRFVFVFVVGGVVVGRCYLMGSLKFKTFVVAYTWFEALTELL